MSSSFPHDIGSDYSKFPHVDTDSESDSDSVLECTSTPSTEFWFDCDGVSYVVNISDFDICCNNFDSVSNNCDNDSDISDICDITYD